MELFINLKTLVYLHTTDIQGLSNKISLRKRFYLGRPTFIVMLLHLLSVAFDIFNSSGTFMSPFLILQHYSFFVKLNFTHGLPYCPEHYSVTFVGLTFMPGPIVEDTTTLFKYWPFAATGLAFKIASIRVWKLSVSF